MDTPQVYWISVAHANCAQFVTPNLTVAGGGVTLQFSLGKLMSLEMGKEKQNCTIMNYYHLLKRGQENARG